MNKKYYEFILFFIFILHADSMSRSFEGDISSQEVHYPIWVDINISENSDSITGSYFYKKVGSELLLTGTSDGKNIVLTEKDKKAKKVTGIFNLVLNGNKLYGTWNNGSSKDSLAVLLYTTNPDFKKFAKIPKPSELLLLENIFEGRITFADEISHFGDKIKKEDSDEEGVFINTLFSRCNILSIELHWTNYWYTARYGTIHHTFDLSTRKEIKLWDNFTPEFEICILSKLQKILTDKRSQYDDSVWLDELFRLENISDVDKLFTVNSIPNRSELFLKNDSLYFWLEDFCEQNYDAGNRSMSFDCMFGMPFYNMQKYLKEGSSLNQLFTKH